MSILDTIIAVYNSEFVVINSRKHFMNLMRGKIGNIKTKKISGVVYTIWHCKKTNCIIGVSSRSNFFYYGDGTV
jgi:hypothetical protein